MTTEDKTKLHDSDCALHNMPAYPNGECNCSLFSKTTTEKAAIKLRTLANQLDTTIGQSEFFFALAENIEAKEKLIRAQEARIAALTKDAEPLSTNFIQTVPDKCDRIVWRGDYFHLPPKISHINFLTNSMEQEFANYERRGYEKGLAAANTNPPAPNQAQWQPIDTAPATPAAILLLTTSRTMKIETGHWARNMVYSSKADGDDCFYTHWMPLPTPPIDEAKDKP